MFQWSADEKKHSYITEELEVISDFPPTYTGHKNISTEPFWIILDALESYGPESFISAIFDALRHD